jgi:tripeptide aminopeptidase
MRHIFKTAFLVSAFLLCASSAFAQQEEAPSIEKKYQREIQKLAKHKKIKAAFEHIVMQEPQTVATHIELTEIPAPPFKEEVRAQAFAEKMKAEGVDSLWIDKEGNVLGLIKGSKGEKTVAVNAHLDTVFPEGTDVRVRNSNDTLYAPGIGDDTRGLAMLLTLLNTLKQTNITPQENLLFVATVGEEGLGDLRGVKALFRGDGPKIDSWISIDGGSLGRVNNKALGSYRYKVTYDGPGGHSWGAFGLANPHHAIGTAIDKFVTLADAYTAEGPKTSYNVGVIEGGTSINSVPFSSSMLIDIRSIVPARLDAMEALLRQATEEALALQNQRKRRGPDLTLQFEKIGNRPSGELATSLPLIQRAMAATAHFGKTPQLTRGSTDANIPISLGIPAVTVGRGGSGGNAHALDEWWYNDKGHEAIQFVLLLALSETGF